MTPLEAAARLDHALARDPAGRYAFACKKAFVTIRLRGKASRLMFAAKDKLSFRADSECLTIEKCDGKVHRKFSWEQIEYLVAGEPEKDDGSLFQG